MTNNAEVTGVDPTGTRVGDRTTPTRPAYAPAIDLTKTANPNAGPGRRRDPVTYTYVATNTGNMTLTNVTVTDSAGPATCAPVTPASVATLAPGARARSPARPR